MVDKNPEFRAVIGLEVHCQLATESKLFCSCQARLPAGQSVAEVEVNLNTCPICSGHPGTLPVLNQKAVEFAIRLGLAMGCQINKRSIFSRKNYFYPDLPRGYQISQYEVPICSAGSLSIEIGDGTGPGESVGGTKKIRLNRIHMEEDAGKSIHRDGYSLVNLNRAGVPLLEIVSEPDLRTAQEAGAYLRSLHEIVTFLGICCGNMQEGNFRCDANISVMPREAQEFGTRAEVKNVNSFRFVEKAIDYEIDRQIALIRSGGRVVQETRAYDSDRGQTLSMRSKENAQDYRYFADPDLIPLNLDEKWIEKIKSELPELPEQKRIRWIRDWGLSLYDAKGMMTSNSMAEFFEKVMGLFAAQQNPGSADKKTWAKLTANGLTGEVTRLLNETGIGLDQSHFRPEHLRDLVLLLDQKVLSSTNGKQVIAEVWRSGESIQAVVDREGLKQVSEFSELQPILDQIIAAFPSQVAEYRKGKDKLLGFFVGQVMKTMGGKANPALLGDLLKEKLSLKEKDQ